MPFPWALLKSVPLSPSLALRGIVSPISFFSSQGTGPQHLTKKKEKRR